MKYKKPMAYILAGYLAAMPALAKAIDAPKSKLNSSIEDKISSSYLLAMNNNQNAANNNIAENNISSNYLIAANNSQNAAYNASGQNSAPKKQPWHSWFYRTWPGRIVSAVIIGGIVYLASSGGKKSGNNGNPQQNPPPPPDPDAHDPDQPDF